MNKMTKGSLIVSLPPLNEFIGKYDATPQAKRSIFTKKICLDET